MSEMRKIPRPRLESDGLQIHSGFSSSLSAYSRMNATYSLGSTNVVGTKLKMGLGAGQGSGTEEQETTLIDPLMGQAPVEASQRLTGGQQQQIRQEYRREKYLEWRRRRWWWWRRGPVPVVELKPTALPMQRPQLLRILVFIPLDPSLAQENSPVEHKKRSGLIRRSESCKPNDGGDPGLRALEVDSWHMLQAVACERGH
eukprot:48053-Hanusia_phi.AAC.2